MQPFCRSYVNDTQFNNQSSLIPVLWKSLCLVLLQMAFITPNKGRSYIFLNWKRQSIKLAHSSLNQLYWSHLRCWLLLPAIFIWWNIFKYFLRSKLTEKYIIMSTTTDNSNIDTNKQAGKDNQDHARLKKSLSHKHSQECPNYAPQGHGPPSKDIGTMYYDCKFLPNIFYQWF